MHPKMAMQLNSFGDPIANMVEKTEGLRGRGVQIRMYQVSDLNTAETNNDAHTRR